MTKSKSEWKSPAVIIAICGLLASLIWNMIQYKQTENANTRGDEQKERADGLQKQKEDYLKKLNSELDDINAQIAEVNDNLRLARSGINLKADSAVDKALHNAKENSCTLDGLNEKRAELEKQLNDLYTKLP